MKTLSQMAIFLMLALILIACNTAETEQATLTDPYAPQETLPAETLEGDEYWARENLDLPRVGTLLERSQNVEEFERYLNSPDGINNLDLNGDGYVDYISVDEFGEDYDDQRGMTLYSRFGPDLIQEIATIFLNRRGYDGPGARVLLRGNEQIYGDNYFYETNWLDRSLGIVTALFGDRDVYRSPYYYDNYPDHYEVYEVVEPAVYVSRVQQLYPTPVFIAASAPAFREVRIRSPYEGRWVDKVYAKMAKPTKEQKEFAKANPHKPKFEKIKGGKKHAPAPAFTVSDVAVEPGKPIKPGKIEKDIRKAEKQLMKAENPMKTVKGGPPHKIHEGKPDKGPKQDAKPKGGGKAKGKN